MVFKGTAVVSGVGRSVVTGTGMDTEMGAIAEMLERTEPTTPAAEGDRIGLEGLGLIVIGIAAAVMFALVLVNGVNSVGDLVGILLWAFPSPSPPCPRACRRSCRWCWRWACSAMARRNAM